MTRGRNTWEDRATAISVGADTISIENLEILAGAFYARDPVPIVSMAKGAAPEDNWPPWPWPYLCIRGRRMRDGSVTYIDVAVHPDPRCQRVLEQIREAGVTQDLDRVRPNHPGGENQLVLDLTYDRVLRHRELVAGGGRIDHVLARTDGVLPLAPAVLVAVFPDIFGSTSTAERAIRAWRHQGRQTPNRGTIWKVTALIGYRYRCAGQSGGGSMVLVADCHADPKAAAEAVLGPLAAFWEAP
jgi:hypothetical protein